jgi:ADP-ribosylation factor-like protein 6
MSGQGNGRAMWKICYKDCLGLVVVIDVSDKDRLDTLKSEIDLLLQSARSNIPIVFLANKTDIPDGLSISDCIKGLGLDQIKANHKIFSTSALSGAGIEESFGWLRYSILSASSPRLQVNPTD